MREKTWSKSIFLLAATVLVAAGLLTLALRYDNKYTARAEISQEGWTMVSENSLSGSVYLADGWELYPDVLLMPSQLVSAETQPVRTFLGEYLSLSPLHADRSPYGTATWRLPIRYDGAPTIVTLALPEIFCASRIFVNGEALAAQGSVEPYRPRVQDTSVSFLLQPETELVVQTANFSHYYGGLTYPPILGTAQTIATHTGARLLFYGVLCFGALTAALIEAAHWLGVRKHRDPVALLFGILTLSFAVWVSYPFSQFLGVGAIRVWYAIEDAASLLVVWCALRITLRLCGVATKRWARAGSRLAFAMLLIGVIVPLFVLPALPAYTAFYGKLVTAYRLLAAVVLVGVSLYGSLRKREVSLLLCGTAFYAVSLFYGARTVCSFEPARFGWLEEYGALALVVCFGVLMVSRSYALLRENLRLNEHLQEEVAEKTRELGLMVNEREDLISKFLHDMKSPAAFMLSYVQMVRQNNVRLDEDTKEQLAVIEEKCGVISDRVRQVQQFTSQNPLITPREAVDLCAFMREFFRFNQPDVEMDGHDFMLRLPKGSCMVWANRDKLNRLLQNLVYNAVSFTPPSGEIRLSLICDDAWAELSVEDTGCGIAPEILPKIFERFFTTRAEDGGTGMGLYIVSTIAKEHGGEVSVQSKPREGTTFTVRLPLLKTPCP